MRVVAVLGWCGVLAFCIINRKKFTVDGIVKIAPDRMPLAVLAMLGLFALKGVSIIIYFGILFAASGILFPLPAAIAVNWAGTVIMVSLPFFIGRFVGYDMVNYLFQKYPKMASIHEKRKSNDFIFTMLLRLTGAAPADPLAFYLGATGSRYSSYLIASMLGFTVSSITFPLMGDNIRDPHSPQFIISFAIEASVVILTSGGFIVYKLVKKNKQKNTGSDTVQ